MRKTRQSCNEAIKDQAKFASITTEQALDSSKCLRNVRRSAKTRRSTVMAKESKDSPSRSFEDKINLETNSSPKNNEMSFSFPNATQNCEITQCSTFMDSDIIYDGEVVLEDEQTIVNIVEVFGEQEENSKSSIAAEDIVIQNLEKQNTQSSSSKILDFEDKNKQLDKQLNEKNQDKYSDQVLHETNISKNTDIFEKLNERMNCDSSPDIFQITKEISSKTVKTYQNKRKTLTPKADKVIKNTEVLENNSSNKINENQSKTNLEQKITIIESSQPENFERRRSQRKKILKYDVRDLLNKGKKKTHAAKTDKINIHVTQNLVAIDKENLKKEIIETLNISFVSKLSDNDEKQNIEKSQAEAEFSTSEDFVSEDSTKMAKTGSNTKTNLNIKEEKGMDKKMTLNKSKIDIKLNRSMSKKTSGISNKISSKTKREEEENSFNFSKKTNFANSEKLTVLEEDKAALIDILENSNNFSGFPIVESETENSNNYLPGTEIPLDSICDTNITEVSIDDFVDSHNQKAKEIIKKKKKANKQEEIKEKITEPIGKIQESISLSSKMTQPKEKSVKGIEEKLNITKNINRCFIKEKSIIEKDNECAEKLAPKEKTVLDKKSKLSNQLITKTDDISDKNEVNLNQKAAKNVAIKRKVDECCKIYENVVKTEDKVNVKHEIDMKNNKIKEIISDQEQKIINKVDNDQIFSKDQNKVVSKKSNKGKYLEKDNLKNFVKVEADKKISEKQKILTTTNKGNDKCQNEKRKTHSIEWKDEIFEKNSRTKNSSNSKECHNKYKMEARKCKESHKNSLEQKYGKKNKIESCSSKKIKTDIVENLQAANNNKSSIVQTSSCTLQSSLEPINLNDSTRKNEKLKEEKNKKKHIINSSLHDVTDNSTTQKTSKIKKYDSKEHNVINKKNSAIDVMEVFGGKKKYVDTKPGKSKGSRKDYPNIIKKNVNEQTLHNQSSIIDDLKKLETDKVIENVANMDNEEISKNKKSVEENLERKIVYKEPNFVEEKKETDKKVYIINSASKENITNEKISSNESNVDDQESLIVSKISTSEEESSMNTESKAQFAEQKNFFSIKCKSQASEAQVSEQKSEINLNERCDSQKITLGMSEMDDGQEINFSQLMLKSNELTDKFHLKIKEKSENLSQLEINKIKAVEGTLLHISKNTFETQEKETIDKLQNIKNFENSLNPREIENLSKTQESVKEGIEIKNIKEEEEEFFDKFKLETSNIKKDAIQNSILHDNKLKSRIAQLILTENRKKNANIINKISYDRKLKHIEPNDTMNTEKSAKSDFVGDNLEKFLSEKSALKINILDTNNKNDPNRNKTNDAIIDENLQNSKKKVKLCDIKNCDKNIESTLNKKTNEEKKLHENKSDKIIESAIFSNQIIFEKSANKIIESRNSLENSTSLEQSNNTVSKTSKDVDKQKIIINIAPNSINIENVNQNNTIKTVFNEMSICEPDSKIDKLKKELCLDNSLTIGSKTSSCVDEENKNAIVQGDVKCKNLSAENRNSSDSEDSPQFSPIKKSDEDFASPIETLEKNIEIVSKVNENEIESNNNKNKTGKSDINVDTKLQNILREEFLDSNNKKSNIKEVRKRKSESHKKSKKHERKKSKRHSKKLSKAQLEQLENERQEQEIENLQKKIDREFQEKFQHRLKGNILFEKSFDDVPLNNINLEEELQKINCFEDFDIQSLQERFKCKENIEHNLTPKKNIPKSESSENIFSELKNDKNNEQNKDPINITTSNELKYIYPNNSSQFQSEYLQRNVDIENYELFGKNGNKSQYYPQHFMKSESIDDSEFSESFNDSKSEGNSELHESSDYYHYPNMERNYENEMVTRTCPGSQAYYDLETEIFDPEDGLKAQVYQYCGNEIMNMVIKKEMENENNYTKKIFDNSDSSINYKESDDSLQEGTNTCIRRSRRIKTKIKPLSGRGVVKNKDIFAVREEDKSSLIDKNKLIEDSNIYNIIDPSDTKDIEERLSQFTTIKENEYNCEQIISKEAKKMVCDCFLTREEEERGELGCGEDCLNRLLMIECGPKCTVGERCTNRNFQKNIYSSCKVFKTKNKGFGIMAENEIPAGQFIMEYVGEVLNSKQFEKRADLYSQDKNKHYYFMALRGDAVIDATARGNISRFINHSCDPNAETQKWTVNGELRIGFFSTKLISAGEEITFDYQFQRYGKEAQKCFCESENCRGWIGEEPDSDDESDEISSSDGDEDEEKSLDENEPKSLKRIKRKENQNELLTNDIKTELIDDYEKVEGQKFKEDEEYISNELNEDSIEDITSERLIGKKRKRRRVLSKKNIDDQYKRRIFAQGDDLDVEEEVISLVHSGLKNQAHTLCLSRLMVRAKILQTKFQLLEILKNGEKPCRRLFLDYHGLRLLHAWMIETKIENIEHDLKFRLYLLETLENLPITNKTILQDSKVFETVQNWANDKDLPLSPNISSNDNITTAIENSEEIKIKEENEEIEKSDNNDIFSLCKRQIVMLAEKLIKLWEELPEIFRIPKRERIEQMKEHEREADLYYNSDEHNYQCGYIGYNSERFGRYGFKPKYKRTNIKINWDQGLTYSEADNMFSDSNLTKTQRRELFEAHVAKSETEKRLFEIRREHEAKCKFFGYDPKTTHYRDLPLCVNTGTGKWYTADGREIETPPSHAHIQPTPKVISTDINDYILPEMDLPPMWRFAIDPKGRLYYYHEKIRISQWEPPIKIPTLANPEKSEELVNVTSNNDHKESLITDEKTEENNDENSTCSAFNIKKLKNEYIQKIRKTSRYSLLVQERPISPRKDEDRIYNQMEVKRYKENKEKIRRRKEEIKKRKLQQLKNQMDSGENPNLESLDVPEKRVEGEPLPIPEYLLSSDEDENLRTNYDTPQIEKIVQSDKIIDELDTLKKLKSLKRSGKERKEARKRKHDEAKRMTDSKSTKSSKHRKMLEGENSAKQKLRKIREKFRSDIAGIIVHHLTPYRKDSCKVGRITNNDDFKHLARKLTHFVMIKELRHCDTTGQILVVTDSVKSKSREFIKKYMAKYGDVYIRPANDREFKDVL